MMDPFDESGTTGRCVDDFPTFECRCCLDDWDAPTSVTIFSTHTADHLETTWVTADHDDTVALEDVR